MATIVEQRSQPIGGYEYDSMRLPGPHFTNPWGAAPSGQPLYNSQQQPQQQQQQQPQPPQQQPQQQQPPHSSDPYASRSHYPTSATAQQTLGPLDPISQPRPFPSDFNSSAPSTSAHYPATAGDRYPSEHYSSSYNSYESRYPQYSQPPSRTFRPTLAGRDSFSDAIDAGQGMVAMSQQDFTPRSAYPPRNGSSDSYGFPTGQSDHGSVSSGSSYPYYGSYSGSADGSVAGSSATDYSSASEDVGQRTLPPPGQLLNGYPADATQMMTQFNSKLAASAQKKHKCKICDKRFTRPSSLTTHMYSHTGEKPFACDFEGCGRHFSVVSNLRRHKKCHKGEGSVDSGSPEE